MAREATPKWVWIPRLVAAGVLAMASVLKLTANPGDVYIFTELGVEPAGRIGAGIVEALAAILLLTPWPFVGAGLALGSMLGALAAHATTIGWIVQDDGGLHLVLLAVVTLASATVLWVERHKLPWIASRAPD